MMSSFYMASVRSLPPFLMERFFVVRDMKPEFIETESMRLDASPPS